MKDQQDEEEKIKREAEEANRKEEEGEFVVASLAILDFYDRHVFTIPRLLYFNIFILLFEY